MKNLLIVITIAGVFSGIALGFILRSMELSDKTISLIAYPGELYMRLLKLLILPLIISSLISGSASLNARLNGKIALRTLLYFLATASLNAALGVILAVSIHPGHQGLKRRNGNVELENRKGGSLLDSLLDLGRNIAAENIFQATFQQAYTEYINTTVQTFDEGTKKMHSTFAQKANLSYRLGTNTLGIVFFCLIFGTLLGTLGPKAKVVVDFFRVIFDVIMKMVYGVTWITPVGVCSLICSKILAVNDVYRVTVQLGWFILTVFIGVMLYQLVIMQLIYVVFVRKNPYRYYFALAPGILTAFATASTAASLPITFEIMDKKVKIDQRISRFVLPIGCNVHMDGTAMFLAIASIFIAQITGISLGIGKLITVGVVSTIMSFSSASVPSAALVLLLSVLASIDVFVPEVSLLFAIDWLVDRIRTTNNMLGNCYTAAIVEKLSKNELSVDHSTVIKKEYHDVLESLVRKPMDSTNSV